MSLTHRWLTSVEKAYTLYLDCVKLAPQLGKVEALVFPSTDVVGYGAGVLRRVYSAHMAATMPQVSAAAHTRGD